MKNLLVLLLVFMSSTSLLAQSKPDTAIVKKKISESLKGSNEIKIDLFYALFGISELTYERILGNNRSVGTSIFYAYNTKYTAFNIGAIPYYRYYFGKRKASGLFLEANAAISKVADTQRGNPIFDADSGNVRRSNDLLFGFGAAIGAKFLTKAGFTGEIFIGAGKGLREIEFVKGYSRFGYTLGKRF